jgi:hypothetical protein
VVLWNTTSAHELVRRQEIVERRALDDNITYSIQISDSLLNRSQILTDVS